LRRFRTGTSGSLHVSGIANVDGALGPLDLEGGSSNQSLTGTTVDFEGVAASDTVDTFSRIDVHAHRTPGGCDFWGLTHVAS
jgi:hypothetical protein